MLFPKADRCTQVALSVVAVEYSDEEEEEEEQEEEEEEEKHLDGYDNSSY